VNFKNLGFVKHRNKYFALSAIVILIGVLSLAVFDLNYGVDFKSGTSLDITIVNGSITVDEAVALLNEAKAPEFVTPTIGGENRNRVSVRFEKILTESERNQIIGHFSGKFGENNISYEENTVDAEMAREFGKRTIYVVAIASLGIILYISVRFEWRFALAGIIALLHDVLVVIGFFSVFRLEVNLTFIAAILTIIGYSINDTVVIFDRIRENLQKSKVKKFDELAELVDASIRQTLVRSINTGLTVVFAAVCLLIFGSEAIKLFSLAMLVGLISGAYSSIFIASQLWLLFKKKSFNKKPAVPAQ
jgi:SecD/SecF fusion protein